MGITEHIDRIDLAVYQLEGEADHWWALIRESRDITAITWTQFKELFLRKYFPNIVKQERIREFLNLEQGTMIVTQYVAKFKELAHYATRYVENDEEKAQKFEWGLDPTIRGRVLPMRLPTFADVVDTALDSKWEVVDFKRIWSLRKENNQSIVGLERNSQRYAALKPYSMEPQQPLQSHSTNRSSKI
ncbi:uncharacterized protein LOC114257441 [Camellia sinensis]|uniref:uncharacterized protein LOC114257441 n=1 Tax=Camellia sinensis TaxID=4442 RepID=UPI001035B5F7|nr:uncharacterized protein LOC114257441 [Camellia sinensis]